MTTAETFRVLIPPEMKQEKGQGCTLPILSTYINPILDAFFLGKSPHHQNQFFVESASHHIQFLEVIKNVR